VNINREDTSVTTTDQPLTARQIEVLVLVAEGLTNGQIGRKLGITEDAAKQRTTRICERLGVNSRAAAVNVAWERGILGRGEMDSARAMQVMAELLSKHADPIHWEAWVTLLGERFATKQDRELAAQLEQAQVSPMPWLHAGRTA
jgi:DNA-binding CsgD family transcriptional regulator